MLTTAEFWIQVRCIMIQCLDYLMGDITRDTFIFNLRLILKKMEAK